MVVPPATDAIRVVAARQVGRWRRIGKTTCCKRMYALVLQIDKNGSGMDTSFPLTLKVLVTTIDAQWEGIGDVRSARYE